MSVNSLENFKCYSVKKDGEWATICIRQTKNEYNGGEILIHSSFGSWGNFWRNIGSRDFREFLSNLDYHYFFQKLDKDLGVCFDFEGTVRNIKGCILQERRYGDRYGDLTEEVARKYYDILEYIEEHEGPYKDANTFYNDLCQHYDELFHFAIADDPTTTKPKSECKMFWDILWKEFVEHLKEELKVV